MKIFFFTIVFLCLIFKAGSQILPGIYSTSEYFTNLKNKNIAIVANQTSTINNNHLLDTLLASGICVKKIFCPEHGFRGISDAGEQIKNSKDKKTGIPIISLYGKNYKPLATDLQNIDIIVFDLQDVGVRFFTYLSTLHFVIEACAENNISLIILDRPNPNSQYIDGPVLDIKNKSFVGMHTVPIVYGMTIGEYAQMIIGEGWENSSKKCKLQVVSCKNYKHSDYYLLPINPSPNLKDMTAIYLYPSLCLFEGTCISVGRGTDFPFKVIGNPLLDSTFYSFTPHKNQGAKNPTFENIKCYGFNLHNVTKSKFTLKYLIQLYNLYPDKKKFFNSFFNKLCGNEQLIEQIRAGKTEQEIKNTWSSDIEKFKIIRKKYLIYND